MVEPLLSLLLLGAVPLHGIPPAQTMSAPSIAVASPVASVLSPEPRTLSFPQPLSASSVVIMDVESAQLLFAQEAEEVRAMASLTKLMTALIITEHHEMDEWVTIPSVVRTSTGSVVHLGAGQEYRIGDLLTALLVQSGNDAAISLAAIHSGTVADFVVTMNQRAKELGLLQTAFANPTGLDEPGQHSSAQDLAWLAMYVMRHPEIKERMGLQRSEIASRDGRTIAITHTHQLLGDEAVLAGKTGTTDLAKQCLLSLVEVGERDYLVVLLHSDDRYGDLRSVISALTPS